MKYIEIVLLESGLFCIAPAWSVNEGDYVGVVNPVTGAEEMKKVIATATDSVDGEYITMLKAYVGENLYRVSNKYRLSTLHWEDEADVSE